MCVCVCVPVCVCVCVCVCRMEDAHGTVFVSLPSLLDPTLAPPDRHIVRIFTPDWIDDWKVCEDTHTHTLCQLGKDQPRTAGFLM